MHCMDGFFFFQVDVMGKRADKKIPSEVVSVGAEEKEQNYQGCAFFADVEDCLNKSGLLIGSIQAPTPH